MSGTLQSERIATCACGQVALAAVGEPIVAAACYCTSCQTAGRQIEALAGAPSIIEEDGGTGFVLQRKDRVRLLRGAEALREHRLKPESSTRRVVANCCNTAMFLEFSSGHWVSIYTRRFAPADRPPLEMRTMTRDRPAGVAFADGLPSYRTHSGRFMWRLFAAWAKMGFQAPKLDFVKGRIDGGAG